MSLNKWTIENELCKLTGAQTEAEALCQLKLLPHISTPYQLMTDSDWERGGEETYIYKFWVCIGKQKQGYIIKACVTPDFEHGIEETINEWLRRRHLLMDSGASVPHLVYAGNGLIIEELIPWLLLDRMHNNSIATAQILPLLVDYAATLARLRFTPIDGFTDLRTRGSDVVVVDFGQDLGPAHIAEDLNFDLLNHLEKTLLSYGILSHKLPDNLRQWFLAALKADH